MTARLNSKALLSLARDVRAQIAEHDGEDLPEGSPLMVELLALSGPDRDRLLYYEEGFKDGRQLRRAEAAEIALDARELAARLRETKEAEAAMLVERVRILREEADAWRERAEIAEAALGRRAAWERAGTWLGLGLFAGLFWVLFLGAVSLLAGGR